MMPPQIDASPTVSSENPLDTRLYFRSPIATLLESLEDQYQERLSLHDISQAYNVLCHRVRKVADHLTTVCNPVPHALAYLRDHSTSLTSCIRRDLSYAFTRVIPDSPPYDASIPDSVPPPRSDPQDEDLKHAEDSSYLCKFCLTVVCTILKFPALSSLFAREDLSYLLDEVTHIATALSLPTTNSQKIRTLSMLALSEQRMSPSIIKGQKRRILSILNTILLGYDGSEHHAQDVHDAFHMVHCLVSSYPTIFLEPLHKFLEATLRCLLSPQTIIRTAAAHALAGYSRAIISCTDTISPTLLMKFEERLCSYAEAQLSSRKPSSVMPPPPATLSSQFTAIISDSASEKGFSDACWAYSILASCILLSNGQIFRRSRMIRYVTGWMQKIHGAFGKEAFSLHVGVWKCFIWSLIRLRYADGVDAAVNEYSKTWKGALHFVMQDLELQSGSALVTLLMSKSPGSQPLVADTIDVINTMVKSESNTSQEEAISLLACLTGASKPEPSSSWDIDQIIPQPVLDGNMLHENERKTAVYASNVDLGQIARFSQDDISGHWDALLTMWKISVRKMNRMGQYPNVDSDLLRIWHELLIAQSDLTQGNGHLAVSPEIIQDTIRVVCQLLEAHEDPPNTITADKIQSAQLKTILHLWIVTKFAVGPSNEGDTAAAILGTVLGAQFNLVCDEVRTPWSELNSELMIAQDPLLLFSLQDQSKSQSEKDLRQRLWTIATTQYLKGKVGEDMNWERKVKLLLVPLANPDMSQDERALWVKVLDSILEDTESLAVSHSSVFDTIVESANAVTISIPASLTFTLLTTLKLKPENSLPLSLFNHINNILLTLYPPQADGLSDALQLFSSLTDFIMEAPGCHILKTVEKLSDSLIVWFRNESGNFTDDVFNENIIPLYCTTLQRLETTPLNVPILYGLTPFLVSPFDYIPIPGIAPRAFKKFWTNTAHLIEGLEDDCPPELQDFHDAWGMMRDEHEFQSQDSQVTFSSIPDSQPATSQEDAEYIYLRSLSSGMDEEQSSNVSESQPTSPSRQNMSQGTDSSFSYDFERLTLPQGAQRPPQRMNLFSSASHADTRQRDNVSPSEDSWPSVPGLSSYAEEPSSGNKKRSRDDDDELVELEFFGNERLGSREGTGSLVGSKGSSDNRLAKRARSIDNSDNDVATTSRKTTSRDRHKREPSQDDYDSWEVNVPSPEAQRIRRELDFDTSRARAKSKRVDGSNHSSPYR